MTDTPPSIAFVGSGEVQRRPLFRALSAFIDTNFEDAATASLDVMFVGDDSWTGTTDAAFDFVMEDERFGPPVVLHPSDESTDEGSLLADLQKDGAELSEVADTSYAALLAEATDPEAGLDAVVAFFNEEDEALTEFVTAMLEVGVPVYDACSQMLAFALAEDMDAESVVGEDAAEDAVEEEPDATPDAATLVEAATDDSAVESLLDEVAALDEDEALALLIECDRDLLMDVSEALHVKVKKGQWAKSIAANIYAAMVAPDHTDEDGVEEQVTEDAEQDESPADAEPEDAAEVEDTVSVDEDDSESAEDEPEAQDEDASGEEEADDTTPVAAVEEDATASDAPETIEATAYDWERPNGSVTVTRPTSGGRVVSINLDLTRLFEVCECDADATAKAITGILSAL